MNIVTLTQQHFVALSLVACNFSGNSVFLVLFLRLLTRTGYATSPAPLFDIFGFKPCMFCLSFGVGHVRSSWVQPRRQITEIRVAESVRFCVRHFLVHCCCGQCCQLTERALRADVTVLTVDTEPASRADVTMLSVDTEHHKQMSLCCQNQTCQNNRAKDGKGLRENQVWYQHLSAVQHSHPFNRKLTPSCDC